MTAVALDRMSFVDDQVIDCPAAPMLAGELRRSGVPSVVGAATRQRAGTRFMATVATDGCALAGLGIEAGAGERTIASEVLAGYFAASGPRTVLLASPRSFCAGVERAIEIVRRALLARPGPVYVRKQIVHNAQVVAELAELGAVFVDDLAEVPAGATVVFSAHGVPPTVRMQAVARGLDVIDATCPLVAKVHAEARRFADHGDTIVLIGHHGHEEVDGTLGEAPRRTVLVSEVADVARLRVDDPAKVSCLTQTTLAVDETAEIVHALRARFPALREPRSDDICYASTNRQRALLAVAGEADLVLVIGSANSSNSVRLVELARRNGTPAQLIGDVSDIRPRWLRGSGTIGLTAGASAPSWLVDAVIAGLRGLGPVEVIDRETVREDVRFDLPSEVRAVPW